MKNLYDEEYYENGIENGVSCYTNYRWIPELTIPLAARMIEYLQIKEDDRILDFGCAKGYLVKAFRLLHRESFGFDLSEYAIQNSPEEICKYVCGQWGGIGKFDWVIAKDVFEHISYDEIENWINRIAGATQNVFAIVPLGEDGKYVVPAYELDVTHIIREDLNWWQKLFERCGFRVIEAKYKVKYIKENWNKWEKGNGFFILESQNKA